MKASIAALNDAFRLTPLMAPGGGRIVFTAGVSDLGVEFSHLALGLVRLFDRFNDDNDPYGEHDFGSLELKGRSCSGRSTTTTAPSNTARRTRPIRRSPRAS